MRRLLVAQRSLQRVSLRVRRETKMLLDELPDLLNQGVETGAFFIHDRRATYERHEGSVGVLDAHSGRAFTSLDDDFDLAVVLFLGLQDAAQGSNSVNLLGSGLVNGGVVLGG